MRRTTDFVEDPRCASASEWMNKLPNVVVVRTFSKVYGMAGMRLGYAVGAKEVIAKMREHVLGNNSNAAVLEAALEVSQMKTSSRASAN